VSAYLQFMLPRPCPYPNLANLILRLHCSPWDQVIVVLDYSSTCTLYTVYIRIERDYTYTYMYMYMYVYVCKLGCGFSCSVVSGLSCLMASTSLLHTSASTRLTFIHKHYNNMFQDWSSVVQWAVAPSSLIGFPSIPTTWPKDKQWVTTQQLIMYIGNLSVQFTERNL
jgi:hypothetical protein